MFLVFDVESMGLYGTGFSVGYVFTTKDGRIIEEGLWATNRNTMWASDNDKDWVENNVPHIPITHETYKELCESFWALWVRLKHMYPDMTIWADCSFPVEAAFLMDCVTYDEINRKWHAPYPLHELATLLFIKGKNATQHFPRNPDELPMHNPLCDARQSARILIENL